MAKGLLSIHITGVVASKKKAQKISEKARTYFPQEDFDVVANFREELNTDKDESNNRRGD